MAEGKVIIVNPDMFGKDPDSKTTKANEVAKSFGLSDAALAEVEDFKAQLTKHNAWDLPFMGYVNEDGYGYAYVRCRRGVRPVLGRPPSIPGAA